MYMATLHKGPEMKRIFLIAIILLLAASASAVEVTVKTNTKLYGRDGKVIREVTAGHPFKAEKLHDKWVWGFLSLRSGGARGWIALDALDLDDDAKRKLGAARASGTTHPTSPAKPTGATRPTEPEDKTPADNGVVLRYRLKQGELQVYEATQELSMEFAAAKEAITINGSQTESVRLRYSVRGKRLAADGTTVAEIRFHALQYQKDTALGPDKTRVEGDENGATLYRNGAVVYSGKWGSSKLAGAPNFSKHLNTTYSVRFDDRGEVQLESVAKKIEAIDLEQMLGGKRVFPKGPVRPGDSWMADLSDEFDNPAEPGATIPIVGKARYTVLERTTHRNRRCVKLSIAGMMTQGESAGDVQIRAALNGTSYIDEATGIQLDTNLTLSIEMTGAIMGMNMKMKGSGRITVAYKGDRLKE